MTPTEEAAELVEQWHQEYFGMRIKDHVLGELVRRVALKIAYPSDPPTIYCVSCGKPAIGKCEGC